jgi:hypothetical protein
MKKIFIFFGLWISFIGWAQPYSVDWFKVSGGGGVSTNG